MTTGLRRAASLAVLVSACAAASAAAATENTVRQLGCLASPPAIGCTTSVGIAGAGQPAIAPDGKQLFVPGADDGALVVYDADGAGLLARRSCVNASGGSGCAQIGGLDRPFAAAVSPDGAFLYVLSLNSSSPGGVDRLFVIQRQGGNLGSSTCFASAAGNGCTVVAALAGGVSVFARDDSVYVAASTSNSVLAFSRAGLSHAFVNCVGAGAGCVSDNGRFTNPQDVVIAPDGAHAYVGNYNYPDLLVVLNRNKTTAALATRGDSGSCLGTPPGAGTAGCGTANGLRETISLALSPDGAQLYVAAQYQFGGGDALTFFDLHADGTISQAGCRTSSLVNPPVGCVKTVGLEAVRDVAVTSDGLAVFAASRDGTDEVASADDGYLDSFARGTGGALTQQPSPFGCLATAAIAGCGSLAQGGSVHHLVVSPDGRHLYATGVPNDGGATRLWIFRVDRAPACSPVTGSTAFNTPTVVRLACSDPDGDPLSFSILAQPARGFLGNVQGDGVPYTPVGGLFGTDTFTFQATGAGITSDPATATVQVGEAPKPPPPPPPPPPSPRTFKADSRLRYIPESRGIRVVRLRVTAPRGARIEVRCGHFCGRRGLIRRARSGETTIKQMAQRRLRAGSKLTILITRSGFIGHYISYRIARGDFRRVERCLPPGSRVPRRCS